MNCYTDNSTGPVLVLKVAECALSALAGSARQSKILACGAERRKDGMLSLFEVMSARSLKHCLYSNKNQ